MDKKDIASNQNSLGQPTPEAKRQPLDIRTQDTATLPGVNPDLLRKPSVAPKVKKPMSQKTKRLICAASVVVLLGFGSGVAGSYVYSNYIDSNETSMSEKQVVLSSESEVLSGIASEVGKSVVSVNVTQTVTTQGFYGQRTSESEGAGTGIILSKDGLVLTNRHVVPVGTTNVSVTLSDGSTLDDVEVVGRTNSGDSLDVAFLQIKDLQGKTLTPAKIGDSSSMKVGDRVIAIGNALGQFENTVTTGILSGYGRNITASDESGQSSDNLENLFQTDAAINQGNSGGPLVNLAGEVIGVNVAIADGAQSVGFSIPINDVKGLITSVEKTGSLQRPYLGVRYIPITADVASEYGLNVSSGAYIIPRAVSGEEPVMPNSPAEKAGLKAGDVITKIDNEAINKGTSLTSLLGKHQVGDTVSITILRDGNTQNIDVTLAAAPSN